MFQTYRGAWTAGQVARLAARGVPLRWVFRRPPDPVARAGPYLHLLGHLTAVVLEEFAAKSLEGRELGRSFGALVEECPGDRTAYRAGRPVRVAGPAGRVELDAGRRFVIRPVVGPADAIPAAVAEAALRPGDTPVVALTLDADTVPAEVRKALAVALARVFWVKVAITGAELRAEAETRLAQTAAALDDDEQDSRHVDRHTD